MQKGWLFVFCVLLLGGCSEREKVTMYPSKNVTQQYQEVQQLLEHSDEIEEVNVLYMYNELFVAMQLKPLEKWNREKIEKQWIEKLEKQFPNETVHVSTDFKLFWESAKLMDEQNHEKVMDKLQQLKKLAKEET